MQLACPACGTEYALPDDALGAAGRTVRCARCGETWQARPRIEAELVEDEDEVSWRNDADEDYDPNAWDKAWDKAFADEARAVHAAAAPFAGWTKEAAAITAAATAKPAPAPLSPRQGKKAGGTKKTGYDRNKVAFPREKMTFDRVGAGLLALLVVFLAGATVFRTTVVSVMPDLAGLYSALGFDVNLRGLTFLDIATSRDVQDGKPGLVVEGRITNVTDRTVPVPPIRLALSTEAGQEIYAWTADADRARLAAGETIGFRSRLASPPTLARRVDVRFADPPETPDPAETN